MVMPYQLAMIMASAAKDPTMLANTLASAGVQPPAGAGGMPMSLGGMGPPDARTVAALQQPPGWMKPAQNALAALGAVRPPDMSGQAPPPAANVGNLGSNYQPDLGQLLRLLLAGNAGAGGGGVAPLGQLIRGG